MSEFMDRARAEAARRDEADSDWYAREAGLLFADGAQWATEQKPTDDEVMEAARAIVPTLDVWGRAWGEASAKARIRAIPLARSALAAAQKVRAGQ